MNILNLNEDCLLHIFSFLDLYDLVNLAQTEDTFKMVTERIFQRHREFTISFLEIRMNKIRKILFYIGPHLNSLTLLMHYRKHNPFVIPVLQTVAKRCKNLKRLTIDYLNIKKQHVRALQHVVSGLEYLEISHCNNFRENIEVLLSKCTKLIYLVLRGNQKYKGAGLENIKTLKKIDVDEILCEEPFFKKLVSQNPQWEIKVFNMYTPYFS